MSATGSFSIRLMNEDGEPVTDREVTVFYDGLFSGSESQDTDDDGWATFPIFSEPDYIGKIYTTELNDDLLVTSSTVLLTDGERVEDGDTFSYTVRV